MFIVLVSLFAAAAAAPQYLHQSIHHGPGYYQEPGFWHGPRFRPGHHRGFSDSFFHDDVFDTGRFWSELSTELRELDNVLNDFYRRFPTSVRKEGIEGNNYKITIPLNGFEEKDIVVKARQGMLMVQAVHKNDEAVVKNYLDVRTLPDCVNVTGSWTYDKDVLEIIFPLKDDAVVDKNKPIDEDKPVVEDNVTEPTLEVSTESREEMEPTAGGIVEDADVGLKRGDQAETEQQHMLRTNQIPDNTFEATTYAVDVKGDVEFVPVQYKK